MRSTVSRACIEEQQCEADLVSGLVIVSNECVGFLHLITKASRCRAFEYRYKIETLRACETRLIEDNLWLGRRTAGQKVSIGVCGKGSIGDLQTFIDMVYSTCQPENVRILPARLDRETILPCST